MSCPLWRLPWNGLQWRVVPLADRRWASEGESAIGRANTVSTLDRQSRLGSEPSPGAGRAAVVCCVPFGYVPRRIHLAVAGCIARRRRCTHTLTLLHTHTALSACRRVSNCVSACRIASKRTLAVPCRLPGDDGCFCCCCCWTVAPHRTRPPARCTSVHSSPREGERDTHANP